MQTKRLLFVVATVVALGAVPAAAADSVLGRISYIYPDGNRLILDSQKTYTLAPGAKTAAIGVAEFVRLNVGDNKTVTSISPGPPELAGYWTAVNASRSS